MRVTLVDSSQPDCELGFSAFLERFSLLRLIEFVHLDYGPADLHYGYPLGRLLDFFHFLGVEPDASPVEAMLQVWFVDQLAKVLDPNSGQLLDRLGGEVGDVEERRLVEPLPLHEHLQEVDQVKRCREVALVS